MLAACFALGMALSTSSASAQKVKCGCKAEARPDTVSVAPGQLSDPVRLVVRCPRTDTLRFDASLPAAVSLVPPVISVPPGSAPRSVPFRLTTALMTPPGDYPITLTSPVGGLQATVTLTVERPRAVVTAIYPAREAPIPGVDADLIVAAVRAAGNAAVRTVPAVDDLAPALADSLHEGTVCVFMGAGDVDRAARTLFDSLRTKSGE